MEKQLFRGIKEKGKVVIQSDKGEGKGCYSDGLRRRDRRLFRGIKEKGKAVIQRVKTRRKKGIHGERE